MPALRPELAALVVGVQDALKAKTPDAALDKLGAASSLPQLTGKETEIIQRLRVVASIEAGKPAIAMASLEALVAAPEVPTSEKTGLIENLISLAQKQKDHQRVIDAAQLFNHVQAPPTRGAQLAVAQAHYFLKNYAQTVQQINTVLAFTAGTSSATVAWQVKPEEYVLRMLADSHTQMKNRAGYLEGLTLLVKHYPSQAYWSDYLSRHISQLEASSPLTLDWYRLVRATQNLAEVDDYLEYAQLALKAGFPQEAQSVLDLGLKSDVLGKGGSKPAVDALRAQVTRRAGEDAGAVISLEQQLAGAANGNAAAQLGDLHLAGGQWLLAHTLYLSALEKGGLRREELTRLRQGIALAQQGQKQAAQTALASAGMSPSAQTLAQAWSLWAGQAGK
ncbi:MAG: hypothetical protein WB821_14705 [Burkholderiaceae bacterium]